jgi:hypothetical protein
MKVSVCGLWTAREVDGVTKLDSRQAARLAELQTWLGAVESVLGTMPIARLRLLLAIADNEASGREVPQNWYAEHFGKFLPDGSADSGFVADQVRGLLGLRAKEPGAALVQQDRFDNDRRSVLLRLSPHGRAALQDLVETVKP